MTTRTIEGRLFPSITWDHGWSLSIQADKGGYACSPKLRLDNLEDYETVEVKIDGPFPQAVDVSTLELPDEIVAKFASIEGGAPCIGHNLNWDEVEKLKTAIVRASLRPNAGIPRGYIGWSGVDVYHGTSVEYAEDIEQNGIAVWKSGGGYFGHAFYVAEERELAVSNYAEFSGDDEGGAVLTFIIEEDARILDLRNEIDSQIWQDSGLNADLGNPNLPHRARNLGIDGVYDRSVGGLAIFNPKVFRETIRLERLQEPATGAPK